MADLGWVALGASVGYGGLALYATMLVVRTRRTHRALRQLQGRET